MSDLAGLSPIGTATAAMRAPQPPAPEKLPPPAANDATARAAREHHRSAAPADRAAPSEAAAPPRASDPPMRLEPDMLVGPPPAFQASILDLEADLQATLARLAADRGQREAEAIMGRDRPAAEAPAAEPPDARPAPEAADPQAAAARDAARTGHAAAAHAEPPVPGESA